MSSTPGEVAAADPLTPLVEQVRDRLAREPGDLTPHRVAALLRATGRPVGDATVLAVHERLQRDILGAGPLEPLLRLPGVTDVLVNGSGEVYLDRGRGLERSDVRFADEAAVRRLAVRLAAGAGRRLDDASPYVDLRLADGTRFHAVLAPLAQPGTAISLRVPRGGGMSLADLEAAGAFPRAVGGVLRRLVAARAPLLVTGGTGTGKTTLLAALLEQVPAAERLVVVEDAAELRPRHPHLVALEARPANLEGAGQVPLAVLVRQALRMRPDRLVVGEVRGAEVVDLLTALNTGHEGGCGTLHANRAAAVPARIEALALAAGLSRAAVHSQLASAGLLVVHLVRGRDGRRRLAELAVPVARPDGLVAMATALTVDADHRPAEGPGAAALAELLEPTPPTVPHGAR